MRATRLQSIIIISKIVVFTLRHASWLIWLSLLHRCSRSAVDRTCRLWAKDMLRAVHASYKIVNPWPVDFARGKKYILMSNHCSHFDIPLIFVAFPQGSIRMIAKKELFRIPLFGYAMKCSEFIAIDRQHRRQAHQDLHAAQGKMANGIILWMAPEGTRSRTGELQPLKKGGFVMAVESGATIIPVGIRGSAKLLPAKTTRFGVGEEVEVHIGQPIAATGYDSKNVRELVAKVEEGIRLTAGEVSIEHKAC